ncbi:PREDICTED: uncharacterized protein LOC104712481 isoform X2 [Camelina sativa]|uniref:Uncharacterized protein LOC104712481 isoform X2 n=1 Tax=Camelina sativa TaxID=90675 RepID=A0ABM0TKE0_CAMSA|nr:PREDICTED: uncharacterized protein LOC104712481 isoform X2 [Camelina sativa]
MFLRNVSLSSDERETQKLTAPEQQQITGVDGQPLIIRIDKDNTVKIGDRVIPPAKIHDGKVIPPAKIQDEEAKLSSTSDGPPVPSWGQVSPHSLIGKSIGIRMPGEYEYIRFQIEHYDVETETHYLVSAFSKKDVQDPCNWVDIRHIPAEDIEWPKKHPKLPEWKRFPEPGETLLHETSTARKKKQLHEVSCKQLQQFFL